VTGLPGVILFEIGSGRDRSSHGLFTEADAVSLYWLSARFEQRTLNETVLLQGCLGADAAVHITQAG
jgi:hypothetical protein